MREIDINFDYSKVKGSTELHNKFKKEFIISCSRFFPDVFVIPYDVGFFRAYSQPNIIVRCGMDGIPDTIVFGNGFYLLFDMKTGKNTLQKNQKNVQDRFTEINKGVQRVFKLKSVAQGLKIIRDEYEQAT